MARELYEPAEVAAAADDFVDVEAEAAADTARRALRRHGSEHGRRRRSSKLKKRSESSGSLHRRRDAVETGDGWRWIPVAGAKSVSTVPAARAPSMAPRVVTRQTVTLPDGTAYDGGMLEGAFEGPGAMRGGSSGLTYDGTFRGGRYHGMGVLQKSPEGETYWGEFWENRRHGHAIWQLPSTTGSASIVYTAAPETLTWLAWGMGGFMTEREVEQSAAVDRPQTSSSDFDVYEGNVQDDTLAGQGIMRYGTGAEYDGQWQNGAWHGWGRLSTPDGAWRRGQWHQGKPIGPGAAVDSLGARFDGTWDEAGTWTGIGTLTKPDGSSYAGHWMRGSKHGKGILRDRSGAVVWDGELNQGERSGRGTLTEKVSVDAIELQLTWAGWWLGGRLHGYGSWERSDGAYYLGEWHHGQRSGQGYSRQRDGTTFDGMWFDNERHGRGTETLTTGESYCGAWQRGNRHGHGMLDTRPCENTDSATVAFCHEGLFANGKPNGQGKRTYVDGTTYSGTWKLGNMDGEGVLTYADGSQYTGFFKNNKRDGYGRYTYPAGAVVASYVGQWSNDTRHGPGVETTVNGDKYDGAFVHNSKTGAGRMEMSSGDVYEGGFHGGKFHGWGIHMYENGDVFSGQFLEGFEHGHGVFTSWRTGAWYSGEWMRSRRHGKGDEWFPDAGASYSGFFADGNPSGRGVYHFAFTTDIVTQSLDDEHSAYADEESDLDAGATESKQLDRNRGTSEIGKGMFSGSRRYRRGRMIFFAKSSVTGGFERFGLALVSALTFADGIFDFVAWFQLHRLGDATIAPAGGSALVGVSGKLGLLRFSWCLPLAGTVLACTICCLLSRTMSTWFRYISPFGYLSDTWSLVTMQPARLPYFNVFTNARALAPSRVDPLSPVLAPDVSVASAAAGQLGPHLEVRAPHRYPLLQRGESLSFFRTSVPALVSSAPLVVFRCWALMELANEQQQRSALAAAQASQAADSSLTLDQGAGSVDLGIAGGIIASAALAASAACVATLRGDLRGLRYHRVLRHHSPSQFQGDRERALTACPAVPTELQLMLCAFRALDIPCRLLLLALCCFVLGGSPVATIVVSAPAASFLLSYAVDVLTVLMGFRNPVAFEGGTSGVGAHPLRTVDGGGSQAVHRLQVWWHMQQRLFWEWWDGGLLYKAAHLSISTVSLLQHVVALPLPYVQPPMHGGVLGTTNALASLRVLEDVVLLVLLWLPRYRARFSDGLPGSWGILLGVIAIGLAGRFALYWRVRGVCLSWMTSAFRLVHRNSDRDLTAPLESTKSRRYTRLAKRSVQPQPKDIVTARGARTDTEGGEGLGGATQPGKTDAFAL